MYWADQNGYLYGPLDAGTEEFPEKTNPDDNLGATCKHLDLFLSNKRWLTKAASVVNALIKTYPDKAAVYLYDPDEIKSEVDDSEEETATDEVEETSQEDDSAEETPSEESSEEEN